MATSLKLRIAVALTLALVLPLMSAPAFASKKTYSNGLASIVKSHDNFCSVTKDRLAAAESTAEATPNTPAGDAAQKDADDLWQKGADAGCSWAA